MWCYNMTNTKNPGIFLVFMGAIFWSLNAPLVKYLTADPLLVCGMRSLIAGIALLPFLRVKRLKWSWWTLFYLLAYCALCISIIVALSMTSAAVAIGMQYTATIWLFLANWILSKKFCFRAFLPVSIVFVGVVFFMCSGNSQNTTAGNFIALSEGIFFAIMSVGAQKSAGTNPLGLTAIANLFTGCFVLLCFPHSTAQVFSLSTQSWVILLLLGIVQIGAGYGFYNLGLQHISAQKASIIALWEMILGPVWVALFLKEYPSLLVAVGFVIILAGMFLDAFVNANGKLPQKDNPATPLEKA